MLSREYSIFIGILLTVMAIVGYSVDIFMGVSNIGTAMPTVWLITGLLALALGFFSKNVNTLRWFAGLVGVVYLIWGIAMFFTRGEATATALNQLLNMIHVGIGALGISAALAPAYWLRERETYAPAQGRT